MLWCGTVWLMRQQRNGFRNAWQKAKEFYHLEYLSVGERRLLKLISSTSTSSNPLWPFPRVRLLCPDPKRFHLLLLLLVLPFFPSSASSYTPPTLSLFFLFQLQLNSCFPYVPRLRVAFHPNYVSQHLTFLLSIVLVASSWFTVPLTWLLLILSPPVLQPHFLKYLISAPVTLHVLLRLVNIVLLYEPQNSAGRQTVL